jgi:hypothetical protein
MRIVLHSITILCIIFSIDCKVRQDTIDNAIVNSKVERKIDVSTHLVKLTATITLENSGKSPVKSFLYAVEPSLQNFLSFISANVSFLGQVVFCLRVHFLNFRFYMRRILHDKNVTKLNISFVNMLSRPNALNFLS